jgi:hypothetical protein
LHLPIVTSVDFPLARAGAGPDWHAYTRSNSDLQFVARLYDVGVGVQTLDSNITAPEHLRGKRIGAPARPSAVRLLTEALLRDGWGVLGDVQLIDIAAGDVVDALERQEIDATTWNLLAPFNGPASLMLPTPPQARFIDIDAGALARLNAANAFALEHTPAPDGARLLSFAQAIAAWNSTPADVVRALLDDLERSGTNAIAMAEWPTLRRAEIHTAALSFFAERGIEILT